MAAIGETPDTARSWQTSHAEALRLAQRLRNAATVFRRYAGELKYHPQRGAQGHIGQELLDAASAVRDTLDVIAAIIATWDEEIAWLVARSPMSAGDMSGGAEGTREAIRLTRAALEIFDQAALHPEQASLDAPYGHGAPRRVHPGAQCTWVAERAEDLAIALSAVALRLENALLVLLPSPLGEGQGGGEGIVAPRNPKQR